MFGSLVLAFPTPHKGGELALQPTDGELYTFDSGNALVPGEPRIGYAAFFSDVEHEVLPVTQGHRITLTYNLYYGKARNPFIPESASERMSQCQDLLDQLFRNRSVLPKGGLLCFGLRHAYPVSIGEESRQLSKAHQVLKGADRLLYIALSQLRLRTSVQLLYRLEYAHNFPDASGLSSEVIDMESRYEDESDEAVLRRNGTLSKEPFSHDSVLWVTPPSGLTSIKYAFGKPYGNEVSHGHIYADLCIVSRIEACDPRIEDLNDQSEEESSAKRRYSSYDEEDNARKRSRVGEEYDDYCDSEVSESDRDAVEDGKDSFNHRFGLVKAKVFEDEVEDEVEVEVEGADAAHVRWIKT